MILLRITFVCTGNVLDADCLAFLHRHEIMVHEVLGRGMFGKVFKGEQMRQPAA